MCLIKARHFVSFEADMPNLAFMPQNIKPMQIRIRVPEEDVEVLQMLGGKTLPVASVASSLLSAALEAVRENQGRLSFPPKMQVVEADIQRGTQRIKKGDARR
jgi:hypothetical protein